MPYIVTTIGYTEALPADGPSVSRCAVATLEEAQSRAKRAVMVAEKGETYTRGAMGRRANHFWHQAHLRVVEAISEQGGTVGLLPDGTVIEVEQITEEAYTVEILRELVEAIGSACPVHLVAEGPMRLVPGEWRAIEQAATAGRARLDAYNARQS